MKIQAITLKNFKRFSDLSVQEIPESARLVVIVGPNGSGKSSLFDALLQWYRLNAQFGAHADEKYYRKDSSQDFKMNQQVTVALHGNQKPKRGCFYIRTAYRNDPDFDIQGFNRSASPAEEVRLSRLIDNDQTVSINYQRLVVETTAALYDSANDNKTVQILREELIGKIRASMKNVFGDLLLNNISDPLGGGAFYFEKGTAKSYHYKNLSGGEKAAFDLILDLHVKKKYFDDAIYCIDELETHLHTRVQGALLKELLSIVPQSSQLWVTTHSLGVLRAAQELETATAGTVCLIDFDGIDADQETVLLPASLGRASWDKMLSITLDDLSKQIAPKHLVVCEGSSIGNRRKNFDAEVYSRVFSQHITDVVFVSGGASSQVAGNGFALTVALADFLPATKVTKLVDRDDKSNTEVSDWEKHGGIVLEKRNIESYLLADDVLSKLTSDPHVTQKILAIKATALENSKSRGNPADDMKAAAGEIYTQIRTLLSPMRLGSNSDAFMRDTLAPLITPDLETYKDLQKNVLDRLA
jgi:predicted ATPase